MFRALCAAASICLVAACLPDLEEPCDSAVSCGVPDAIVRADAAAADARTPDVLEPDTGEPPDAELDAGFVDAELPDRGFAVLRVETTNDALIESAPPAILCGRGATRCEADMPIGRGVTLTAMDTPRIGLVGWDLDCSGSDPIVMLTMDRDRACSADFVRLGGQVLLDKAPGSVLVGAREDDAAMHVFREISSKQLGGPIPLEVVAPGRQTIDSALELTSTGSVVLDSYYVFLDPTADNMGTTYTATIGFPREIVGLIVRAPALEASDPTFGANPSFYPPAGSTPARGLDLSLFTDYFEIDASRRRLELVLGSGGGVDHVRVLVRSRGQAFPIVHSQMIDVLAAPPPDVRGMAYQSNAVARLFRERDVTLGAPLAVEIDAPGTYDRTRMPPGGTIPASTRAASWFLHFDPFDETILSATVLFDRPILGLVLSVSSLDASDRIFGSLSTTYGTSMPSRAFGIDADFSLTLHEDRRTVTVVSRSSGALEQLRVIVEQ
jgi:hypothetical protein